SRAGRSWRAGRMPRRDPRGGVSPCRAQRTSSSDTRRLGGGDWAGARRFLHDDLSFVGPFESFRKPEPYIEALQKLHHIIARVEPKKMFVDGDDVCMLYDMVTKTPAGTAFICECYRVRGT